MTPLFPLLGLILRGDAYGYELKQSIASEFDPHWRIDYAQLYRSLAKLKAQGFVRARASAGDGGPARKIYAATARGKRAFEAWLTEPAAAQAEFWVKARLAATLGYDADALVRAEQARVAQEHAARRARQAVARADGDASQLALRAAALQRVQAESDALALAQVIFQAPSKKARAALPLALVGSDDPLLKYAAQAAHLAPQVMGSMAGLAALAAQEADIAGTHLRDAEAHEYNLAFVQRLIPEEDILLVNFAVREYGLLVARGNPKKIHGVRDLARRNLRMLNRPRGAGARLWLYQHARAARLDPQSLRGWDHVAATYDALATALEQNLADAGPGLRVTAEQRDLDFISLGEERFDLAMPRRVYESARAAKLFDQFESRPFRAYASGLRGYELSRLGRVVGESKFGRAASRYAKSK
ncbi:hypothetical protein FBQ82_05520 [Anaerolineae bacterium CFX7]|nr:hypothetical protein [Anaerolineae bacterium CFX7]